LGAVIGGIVEFIACATGVATVWILSTVVISRNNFNCRVG
jgi:hypothetical protein